MMHRSKSALTAALSLFLLLAGSAGAQAPASPPDTPQGRRIAALIAAFETGTPDAIRTFVTGNFAASAQKQVPLEQRVQRLGGMAKEVGPIAFHQMLPSQAPEIKFLARGKKTQDWVEIGMMLEPAPDFGILGLKFEDSQGPGAAAETRKGSDAEVAAAADALLSADHGEGSFSGVVLIAKNGKPFFHKAYGMANRDLAAPNRPDTKFNLGSINKVFTQVAIAQLAEQGKLSLSDTIRKRLPDYPSPVADKITIQQLLTMTSGLGDFFGERYDATPKSKFRTLADFLPMFVNEPLLFEPGTSKSYSNAGYIVLGLIIEKVSGESYYDYVRQHVFLPAGMKDTDAYMQDAIVPNRAVGYTRESEDGKTAARAQANQRLHAARALELGRRRLLDGAGPARLRRRDARRQAALPGVDGLVLLRQVEGPGRGRRAAQALRRLRLRRRLAGRQRRHRDRPRHRLLDRRALERRPALGGDRGEKAPPVAGVVVARRCKLRLMRAAQGPPLRHQRRSAADDLDPDLRVVGAKGLPRPA